MTRPTALARAARALLLAALAAATATAQTSTADLEALYWERQREAQTRYTPADVDFMVGMIGHHAQALVMTQFAEPNGASPAVRTLAARITNAQRDEIETMQRWLRDRDEAVPSVRIEGTLLTIGVEDEHAGMDHGAMDHSGMDHGTADPPTGSASGTDHGAMGHGAMGHGAMHDHLSMPGMLSQAQLDELAAAEGAAFDRLFLAYMIQHHGGAVVMVEDLFATDGAGQDEQAFKFASDVQVDQRTEIARMQQMLDALTDERVGE